MGFALCLLSQKEMVCPLLGTARGTVPYRTGTRVLLLLINAASPLSHAMKKSSALLLAARRVLALEEEDPEQEAEEESEIEEEEEEHHAEIGSDSAPRLFHEPSMTSNCTKLG